MVAATNPLATFSRMIATARRDAESDRDKLASENLPLMIEFVRRIRHSETSDDDLQNGAIAMLHAAKKFDPSRGVKFSTYAVRVVRNATLQYYRFKRRPIVTSELPDPVAPCELPEWVDEEEAAEMAARALDCMTEREQLVIRRRFFEGKTLNWVGAELGISKEGVRLIAKKGIDRARRLLSDDMIGDFRRQVNKEGQLASLDEQPVTACPYGSRMLKDEWVAGWKLQRPPGGEWN